MTLVERKMGDASVNPQVMMELKQTKVHHTWDIGQEVKTRGHPTVPTHHHHHYPQ